MAISDETTDKLDTQATISTVTALEPPVWQQIIAEKDQRVEAATLAFTLEGERVTMMTAGEHYFVVDKQRFEHFVPRNQNDLVKLQLPNTTLRPLGPTAAYIEMPASWYVPENIPGELSYRVHYLTSDDVPAGTRVDGPFTIWITPEEENNSIDLTQDN